LATITFGRENEFVNKLRRDSGAGISWIGGYQLEGAKEPCDGWTWVNHEDPIGMPQDKRDRIGCIFNSPKLDGYEKWRTDADGYYLQPNSQQGTHAYLELRRFDRRNDSESWNDSSEEMALPYIVEIDAPLLTYHGWKLPGIYDFIVEVGDGDCTWFSDAIEGCNDHQCVVDAASPFLGTRVS